MQALTIHTDCFDATFQSRGAGLLSRGETQMIIFNGNTKNLAGIKLFGSTCTVVIKFNVGQRSHR